MNEAKPFVSKNFEIPYKCIATIVNNKDPEDRGRLQVRIHNILDDSVTDANCPWAETMSELFGASNTTVGFSSVPKVGSWVYVEFLYHNPSYPLVCGIVRGNKDSSLMHTAKNLGSTIYGTRVGKQTGPELTPLNNSSVYPFNNVIETTAGIIELDDTPGNERVAIEHKNGSYYEIRPNGDIQIKSDNNTIQVSKGNLELWAGGNIKITAGGNITINGAQIFLN